MGRRISIIDGFAAEVPIGEITGLDRSPEIVSVTPDATVHLLGTVDGMDPNKHPGSWLKVAKNTKLYEMWQKGWTGEGIDVALIDSGVAPLPGIDLQVINGPDLSFDSQAPNLTDIDTYGHGTHMAGLIAGRDADIPPGKEDEEVDHAFVGAAPGARIVSIKVATSDGATDVSQVIAAIDWIVQHRNSDGLNIRVLNLSFGTDGT
ncbi:MAG TPA: S8 family serine peptidase, partial [Actinomycetota bacterium]|nr:S8 family serine peptidase [Actinomycetota bacterium]